MSMKHAETRRLEALGPFGVGTPFWRFSSSDKCLEGTVKALPK
jgi:hypothetical protein